MIDQDFKHADSIVKEMTHVFDTRVENFDPREEKKMHSAASKIKISQVVKKR